MVGLLGLSKPWSIVGVHFLPRDPLTCFFSCPKTLSCLFLFLHSEMLFPRPVVCRRGCVQWRW